jgi:hypothetical protein
MELQGNKLYKEIQRNEKQPLNKLTGGFFVQSTRKTRIHILTYLRERRAH